MEKAAENQMCAYLSLSKDYFLCVLVLALIVSFTCISSSFSSILLAFTVLVLSTVPFFTFNKSKPVLEVKDEVSMEEVAKDLQPENQVAIVKDTQEVKVTEIQDYLVHCPDLSEGESVDDLSLTSEDSDINRLFKIPTCSDDSISDDDSLIEIALPEGHYISPKEDQKSMSPQNLPEFFLPESIFRQEGLMELLAEMNEEDNLFEIDISMGSIKCSRFEIEA